MLYDEREQEINIVTDLAGHSERSFSRHFFCAGFYKISFLFNRIFNFLKTYYMKLQCKIKQMSGSGSNKDENEPNASLIV